MTKPVVVCDVECYPNYFLVGFRNVDTGEVKMFRTQEALKHSQRQMVRNIMRTSRIITFNGRNYDIPMIYYALTGATVSELKSCSDDIILHGLKYWHIEDKLKFRIPRDGIEHWDLIDVAFGKASLKIYGGRLHSKRMRDLPFDPNSVLTATQIAELEDYWLNDLETTIDLYRDLKAKLELRQAMTSEYGIDMMSKSDAQIAEAIIKHGLQQKGIAVQRPTGRRGDKFKYVAPRWLSFQSPKLQEILRRVTTVEYFINENDVVELPAPFEGLLVGIGNGSYRMGIGGLHSSEERVAHYADEHHMLVDRDVTSYYPSIILGLGLYPDHLGPAFLEVYRGIVERRVSAKRRAAELKREYATSPSEKIKTELSRQETMSAGGKIGANSGFGKFNSKWSFLYSPELLIRVTLTGQLALLMLIEMIENAVGQCAVVSANTDGIVIKCPRSEEMSLALAIEAWENVTGFNTEETHYASLYSRDVNNYVAIKPGFETKTRGAFSFDGLDKNPNNMVCNDAVINYLLYGVPPEYTVNSCTDVRRFITIRHVNGGAVTDQGEYLGKAVRWYHSTEQPPGHIKYVSNGNLVPETEGCKPMMELRELAPKDLDYQWYVGEAYKILKGIGA